MPIIHGNDAYTGVEISEESAWGTQAGTWYGVPIISETLRTVRDPLPSSPEFGATGAEVEVATINPRVEGEITFSPRLDARWFHWFLGQLLGTENLEAGTQLDGSGGGTADVNTHWYQPSQQGRSLSIRVYKSGPSTGGQLATFSGMQVRTGRIEWAPDNLLQVTIGFIGKLETMGTVAGAPTAPVGAIGPEARWLTQNSGKFQVGSTLANINVRGFTIDIDRAFGQDPAFMNSLSTANQPGPTGNRIVRGTIQGLLEDNYASAAGKPYKDWLDNVASKCRIFIRDSTDASDAATIYYGMDIDFPSIKWTEADYSVKEAGSNPTTASFQAVQGTTASPATGSMDVRIGVLVDGGATPDLGDTYASVQTGSYGVTQS